MRVANFAELSYQDIDAVSIGYNYLVVTDSNNGGLWTIYTVIQDSVLLGGQRRLQLIRVQNYDTKNPSFVRALWPDRPGFTQRASCSDKQNPCVIC